MKPNKTLLNLYNCLPRFILTCSSCFLCLSFEKEEQADQYPANPHQVKSVMKSSAQQAMREVCSEVVVGQV